MTSLAAACPSSFSGAHSRVSDFVALLKPRVMTLVVFTGVAGIVAAPGDLHPFLSLVAVLCIALASGAAGAVNMWYERDVDALMERTRGRPLPQGRIDPAEALSFGVVLSVFSVLLMGIALNWVAAGLLAAASLFYIFVYTVWLKRRTPQNIVIGGAAGAFPPMIGWAAVTGDVALPGLLMFALIFFWTPPHFWALALYRSADYKKAGIPMLPAVEGEAATRRQILIYSLILTPFAAVPVLFGGIGALLGLAVLLHALFLISAWRVFKEAEGQYRYARLMFGYSIFYLFALFGLMMAAGVGA